MLWNFLGGNLVFVKIKKLQKFVLLPEPALKCEINAIFMEIYTLKLFIAFKMFQLSSKKSLKHLGTTGGNKSN